MEHQCLHLIIAPLLQQPRCELTPHEHSMYFNGKTVTDKIVIKHQPHFTCKGGVEPY